MFPLHVHSNYSLLNGVISIDKIIEYTKKYNLTGIALTDTNGMYGLIAFAKKCVETGIKPILGTYISEEVNENINAVLLAKNNEGYSDICKIITAKKLNDDFSLIEIIKTKSENLFVISNSFEVIKECGKQDNFYVELISTKKSKRKTRNLYEYSIKNNIKYLANHPVYFPAKEDYLTHQTVTAIKRNENIDNITEDDLVDPEFYFKDPSYLDNIWRTLPEAIEANHFVADNCNVDLKLGEYKYPHFPVPKGEDSKSYLWKIAYNGLKHRYKPVTETAKKQFDYELEVINELTFNDYFLIVWDIAEEARKRGMMMIGRGSAANSIISYCLRLTQVDPIEHNFYFERFLNKGRSNPPDVDLDFSWRERDEIVKYVFEKYGYENVAMISTTVTFKARSAFREVAKAFGITNQEISTYSKFIPWTDAQNLPNVSALFPESKNLKLNDEPWKTIVEIAVKIANFPRHLSIHPGGIVITPSPITNYTALEYAKNKGLGLIITQPDMYGIEDLGLIKIDLLSQRSLGVLRDTMNMISDNNR